jgi:MFS family permease
VIGLYIALGIVYALDQPTADAIAADMNQGEDIRKAANMMHLAQFVGRVGGALLGGLLLEVLSPAAVFWFDALSFLPVAYAMLRLTTIPQPRKSATGGNLLHDFGEGLRTVTASPRLFDILICMFFYSVLSSVSPTLYPAFVQFTLRGSGADLGVFQAVVSIGGVIAALTVLPLLLKQKRTGMIVLLPMVASALMLLAIGLLTRRLLPAAVLAGIETVASSGFFAMMFGLIGSMVEPHLRGRVFSLFQMVLIGSLIPGALLSGFLAQTFGPDMALAVYGGVLLIFAAAMLLSRPALAAWRHEPAAAPG